MPDWDCAILAEDYMQLARAINTSEQLHDVLQLHFPHGKGSTKTARALRDLFCLVFPSADFKVGLAASCKLCATDQLPSSVSWQPDIHSWLSRPWPHLHKQACQQVCKASEQLLINARIVSIVLIGGTAASL